MSLRASSLLLVPLALVVTGAVVRAASAPQDPPAGFADAEASDPARRGWMVGSPPPDRIVRFEDGSYWRFHALRKTVSNFRQLMLYDALARPLLAKAR